MHTGRRYTPLEFIKWTRRDLYWMLFIAAIPTLLYWLEYWFIALPFQPIAILGTAVAFIVGFKNNASYNRIWEARQIYGAIINDSRSFAYTLRDNAGGRHADRVRRMFYRHFAWLTAMRFQLREPRPWEICKRIVTSSFRKITIPFLKKRANSTKNWRYTYTRKNSPIFLPGKIEPPN